MQTSSPFCLREGLARIVPHVHSHAEAGPWISPFHTGLVGIAEHEAAKHVRAARDGGEVHVAA